jgi:hypothetical protein
LAVPGIEPAVTGGGPWGRREDARIRVVADLMDGVIDRKLKGVIIRVLK